VQPGPSYERRFACKIFGGKVSGHDEHLRKSYDLGRGESYKTLHLTGINMKKNGLNEK